ncbi:unnamed protein product [Discula destructiva]
MATQTLAAMQRVGRDLKDLTKEKWVNITPDERNMFRWTVALMIINSDSAFNGGYFKCEIMFPQDYPYTPPNFRFLKPLWHPNVYPDGRLCISILHSAGDDGMSGEEAGERWTPLQTAESVLRSVLLLLDDPEINSPANVDASVMYRDSREEYNKRAAAAVAASKADIPRGFVIPTTFVDEIPEKHEYDDDFYADSDEDDFDFDEGSDSENNMDEEEDEDEDEDAIEGESDSASPEKRPRGQIS